MKTFTRLLILIIVLLAILATAMGNMLLEVAVDPASDRRHQIDSCYEEVYRKYPEMQAWHDSLIEHGLWRDTILKASDGSRRHGLILMHDSLAKGSSVVLHGYDDNAIRMMRYFYMHYEILGRNVIIPDHFGHGMSDGDRIRFAWLDRLDVRDLWIPLAHELWPSEKMVVHGLSMGGAMTMFTSGESFPDTMNIIGYIEDCGYSCTWDQLAYQLKDQYGFGPWPLLYIANILCNLKYGWDMKEADARRQVAQCTRPMLFIHGGSDDFVPTSMVYECYEAKTQGWKELWVVPEANHARSIHKAWDEYCQRCEEFINRCEVQQE